MRIKPRNDPAQEIDDIGRLAAIPDKEVATAGVADELRFDTNAFQHRETLLALPDRTAFVAFAVQDQRRRFRVVQMSDRRMLKIPVADLPGLSAKLVRPPDM